VSHEAHTSVLTINACPPFDWISSLNEISLVSFLEARTTFTFNCDRAKAEARPIPLDAPVIITTFPLKNFSEVILANLGLVDIFSHLNEFCG
jgi:hypothetical protein